MSKNKPKPLDLEELNAILKVGNAIIDKVVKCKFCGSNLNSLPYGFECKKCGYVILLDDVKERLDRIFNDKKVNEEEIIYTKGWESGYEAGKEEIKQSIKSACEFYLRYKDDPILFWKEQREYRNIFKEEFGLVIIDGEPMKPIFDYLPKYNDWLFRLAFKGVLETKCKKCENE